MSGAGLLEGMMQEAQVVEFLARHPEFFLRHKGLLDNLLIPHEVKGAVSLLELQQERLRERIRELEQQDQALRANAARSERIFRVYGDVYPELFHCTTLRQLWKRLHHTFREQLGIPVSALWVNAGQVKVKRGDKGFALDGERFRQLCQQPMGQSGVYFGPLAAADTRTLFGDESLVHSAALLRLGERRDQGLLAFGHADPSYYHPGMDSLLLEQLGRFVTLLLPDLVVGRV